MFGIYSILDLIFWLLAVGALGMSGFSLVHALRTPARAFAVTGKQTKRLWSIILGFATLFTFAAVLGYVYVQPLSIFTIASVIASGVYLADVRPAVKEIGKGGNSGPYGPW
ncbi:hypothetical protein Misp01_55410 [Microtetraspora sp. NBRC 13810]|uniref:DUF2516 family protein n=1 Tax=Microtetraspora sp. NBRC 13810 TaxID=3030990 RepID=UPI0024A0B9AD|nr:DUF2516 family protein [Microtetraspora sp. NBRC 13810]GLW10413.1 hypothetical protein Misp01_55410 [Microtetraspora sp. NBRC 13810]